MPRVRVEGWAPVEAAPLGATLLEVCEGAGIPMESACGGFAACNSCRVQVLAGALGPLDEREESFLDAPDQRLGCVATVVGDVDVRLDPGA